MTAESKSCVSTCWWDLPGSNAGHKDREYTGKYVCVYISINIGNIHAQVSAWHHVWGNWWFSEIWLQAIFLYFYEAQVCVSGSWLIRSRMILQLSFQGLRWSDSEQVSTDKRWAGRKKRMSDRNGDGCRFSSSQTTPACLKKQKQTVTGTPSSDPHRRVQSNLHLSCASISS